MLRLIVRVARLKVRIGIISGRVYFLRFILVPALSREFFWVCAFLTWFGFAFPAIGIDVWYIIFFSYFSFAVLARGQS